jgi:hypothetical protein
MFCGGNHLGQCSVGETTWDNVLWGKKQKSLNNSQVVTPSKGKERKQPKQIPKHIINKY